MSALLLNDLLIVAILSLWYTGTCGQANCLRMLCVSTIQVSNMTAAAIHPDFTNNAMSCVKYYRVSHMAKVVFMPRAK